MMPEKALAAKLQELTETVDGLRLEVEGSRKHTSFLVQQVEALLRSVEALKKEVA